MTNQLQHQFLWFKLATTGLIDDSLGGLFSGAGAILEFALALVADSPDETPEGFGKEVVAYTSAVKFDRDRCTMTSVVEKTHTKSGLLADCEKSTLDVSTLDTFLFETCQQLTGKTKPRMLKLAGCNPAFDLQWVNMFLPKFASCLSYQVFDISGTLADFFRKYSEIPAYDNKRNANSRAIDDVRYAVGVFDSIVRGANGW